MFSEEEEMLRDTVARFAQEKIAPKVAEMDTHSRLDPELKAQLFEQGLMGVEIPVAMGGGGMTFFDSVIIIEELAKVDPAVSVIVDVQNTLVIIPFLDYASPSLQSEYLPQLAGGKMGCFCLTEMGSGSDAFALKTTAKQDGDDYIINGSKAWITNSSEAEIFIVFANADPSRGYKGITAFVVDRTMPGVEVAKKEDKLGIRASSTCEVHFTDVRVPKKNIFGEFGQGYKIAMGTLNPGRIGIAAQMLGLAEGALNHTMPYISNRSQFGQRIADFQAMQHQYARCAVDIEAAKCLVYNTARLKCAGQPYTMQAAMAKLHASEVAERVSSMCVNMCGGVGFMRTFPVEKYFRDCKIGQIYEGTSNIQLQTIAKEYKKLF